MTFCGCKAKESDYMNKSDIKRNYYDDYYISVGHCKLNEIVYAKDTKVMYTISAGAYNSGSVTMLVNSDGTPLIYKEQNK